MPNRKQQKHSKTKITNKQKHKHNTKTSPTANNKKHNKTPNQAQPKNNNGLFQVYFSRFAMFTVIYGVLVAFTYQQRREKYLELAEIETTNQTTKTTTHNTQQQAQQKHKHKNQQTHKDNNNIKTTQIKPIKTTNNT